MVEYANQLGRPHFEVCVVRRVVKSFATGVDDIFKPAIQKMIDDKNKRNASNRRRELLNEFCEDRSYMKLAVFSHSANFLPCPNMHHISNSFMPSTRKRLIF